MKQLSLFDQAQDSTQFIKWPKLREYLFALKPKHKSKSGRAMTTYLEDHFRQSVELGTSMFTAYMSVEMAEEFCREIVMKAITRLDNRLIKEGELKSGYNYFGYLSTTIRTISIDEQRRLERVQGKIVANHEFVNESEQTTEIELEEEGESIPYLADLLSYIEDNYPKHSKLIHYWMKCHKVDQHTGRFVVHHNPYYQDQCKKVGKELGYTIRQLDKKAQEILQDCKGGESIYDNHDGSHYTIVRLPLSKQCLLVYHDSSKARITIDQEGNACTGKESHKHQCLKKALQAMKLHRGK